MMIVLTATGLGFFWETENKNLTRPLKLLKRGLLIVIILGRIWQLGKLIASDFFFSFGYGKLDDFHFGINPPIYYLTGFEGTLRWQGLFAGPNNYGYFLVLFLPFILTAFPISTHTALNLRKKKDWLHLAIILIWLVTIGATLSRTALIGIMVIGILSQLSFLRSHKKRALGIGGVLLVALLGLSLLKWESTIGHLHAKFGGIQQVINAPLGYGL